MTVANRAHELNHTNIALSEHTRELQERNARLQATIDAALDAIVTIDARGIIQYVNPATVRMFGYTSEDLIGHNVSMLMPSPDKERHDEYLARYRKTGKSSIIGVGREVFALRKDGTLFPAALAVTKTTVNDEPMYTGTLRDLTERTRFERQLNTHHVITRILGEAPSFKQAIPQILLAICIYMSRPFGAFWLVDFHAHELRCVDVYVSGTTSLKTFVAQTREMTFAHGVGLPGRVWASGQPEWVADFVDLVQDPTYPRARVAAQEGLHGAFAFAIRSENTVHGVIEFFGYGCEEEEFDTDLLHMFDTIGTQIGQFVERKMAEEALRDEHAHTEQLLASISSILIGLDEHGTITRWNNTATETFSLAAGEVLGITLHEIGITWDWPQIERAITRCMTFDEPVRLDALPYTTPFGNQGFLGLTLSPLIKNADQPTGALVVGVDLTERKQLEVQLALAQKMESIGQLAAGIAHEVNTPIQYVSDNLRFLHESFAEIQTVLEVYGKWLQAARVGPVDPQMLHSIETVVAGADLDFMREEIPKAIAQSLEGSERVARIVRSMKDFSHPGTVEKKPVDLNRAIESTITVSRNEWKYVADLVPELDPALPLVSCLPGELNQVLLNLIVNAAHTIADTVGNDNSAKGRISISTRVDGDWVEIRIADTGMGIPEKVRGKIFDPFFTTKDVGKGTGQGLAIAHDVVVKQHGGALTFETAMGEGTTFVIRLPLDPVLVPQEI